MNKKQMLSSNEDEVAETRAAAALPPPLPFTSERIRLPLEMIFKIGENLELLDYRNYLQALWPKNDVYDIHPRRLWHLSTHQFTTMFCNGKQLRVEYNMDPSREEDEQILIKVNDVLPLFDEAFPPNLRHEFLSISELAQYARTGVHLDRCSDYRHAACECHLHNGEDLMMDRPFVPPEVEDCENGHFHHYCSHHLADWLKFFLAPSVMLRETGQCGDEETRRAFVTILMYITYVRKAHVPN